MLALHYLIQHRALGDDSGKRVTAFLSRDSSLTSIAFLVTLFMIRSPQTLPLEVLVPALLSLPSKAAFTFLSTLLHNLPPQHGEVIRILIDEDTTSSPTPILGRLLNVAAALEPRSAPMLRGELHRKRLMPELQVLLTLNYIQDTLPFLSRLSSSASSLRSFFSPPSPSHPLRQFLLETTRNLASSELALNNLSTATSLFKSFAFIVAVCKFPVYPHEFEALATLIRRLLTQPAAPDLPHGLLHAMMAFLILGEVRLH